MSIQKRVLRAVPVFLGGLVLAACGGIDSSAPETGSATQAISVPYSATDLGAGSVKFSVTLPAGQNYVEVFSRQNGVQNLAHDIAPSGVSNGDGTETYSYTKSGYQVGDNIEYRFYSYTGPGVFTPGPGENVWVSFKYGAGTFQTSAGNYTLGSQKDTSGRTFSYQVETTSGKTFVTPYSTGWYLTKASPGNDSVQVKFVEAELVGTFVKKAGSSVYDAVTAYDSYAITATKSAAWLDISVIADQSQYPGTRVDAAHAEGGHFVTLPTFIGPQTLLTDATVTFAYLIKQKTWAGQ